MTVEHFDVVIHNDGAFDVNVVAEQPHGHEACPSSVAAWTVMLNRTLKAGQSHKLTLHPVDNSLIVPLRTDINGTDCVSICALSVARQAIGGGVTNPPKQEVGLRLEVKAVYTASGNALQGGEFFAMRTLRSDAMMFAVDNKPPVPIAIRDIVKGAYKLSFAGKDVDSEKYLVVTVWNKGGGIVDYGKWTGLSKQHIYRLPFAVPGLGKDGRPMTGGHIRWDIDAWLVMLKPDAAEYLRVGNGSTAPAFTSLAELSADDQLVPLTKSSFVRLRCARKVPTVDSARLPILAHGGVQKLVGADWQDDVLTAVSFILGVIKIAAAVAGAIGVLNVVGTDGVGVSSDDE